MVMINNINYVELKIFFLQKFRGFRSKVTKTRRYQDCIFCLKTLLVLKSIKDNETLFAYFHVE